MTARPPTIDVLLNLVPDDPNAVLTQLRAHPELALKQDGSGYSLVHAAASYDKLDLLKALVQEFNVDPNITDMFRETALFGAETVAAATELVNLGLDPGLKNSQGMTAAEYLDNEDEYPDVAAYLRGLSKTEGEASTSSATGGSSQASTDLTDNVRPPPPMPNGVQVSVGTMHADDVGDEPDPEFRRRIEELAARQDFEGSESQNELRDLISDAVSGMRSDGPPSATRRRIG